MNRASLLGFVIALPALGAAFFACRKEDPRPPVSDGPGAFDPNKGSGSGSDAGAGDGSIVGPFASFPGYEPSGLFADGDTAYVTLVPIDTSQSGQVVRVDPSGAITILINDATAPLAPMTENGFVYYLDQDTTGASALKKIDLSNVGAGAVNLATGFEQPSAIVATPGNSNAIAVSSNSGGTGVEVDSIEITTGSSTPISSLAGEFSAAALQADGTSFYFAAKAVAGGQIEQAPLNGGVADNLWTGGTGTIGGMAVSNGTVYFALDQGGGNGVINAAPSSTSSFVIASGIDAPTDVVVVKNYVYIASNSSATGGIYRALLDPEAGLGVEPVLTGGPVSHLALGQTVLYGTADQALVRVQ